MSAQGWEGCTEIREVGVSGPPRSRSYQPSSAQPRVSAEAVLGQRQRKSHRAQVWGCDVWGCRQKFRTLVRMESMGGP